MPNFAKASLLTIPVMIAMFLVFLQTQLASDIVRMFGLIILPFSIPLFIIATLNTKPKRTMGKFVRNLLVANSIPAIFLFFAQPILAILLIGVILALVVGTFGGAIVGGFGQASSSQEYETSGKSNFDKEWQRTLDITHKIDEERRYNERNRNR